MTLVVHLIPHTHWDREWYLTAAESGARLAPMMDGLLDLLDRVPTLRFHLDGQAVLVEDYLALRPDRRPQLQRAVADGQLVIGPWYVLADGLIPSGEAAIRNLLLGLGVAKRHGAQGQVLYNPDAFGHGGSGPLVAAQAGLLGGVVWRGVDPGRIGGRDLFWWCRGEHRLLTLHLPPAGYEFGAELVGDEATLASAWRTVRATVVARAASNHVAVLVGADHHAPSERLVGLPKRLADIDRDATFRFSSFEEYFAAASNALPTEAPAIEGELRRAGGHTWVLQGVHATRSRLKRQYSLAELDLLRIAEPVATLAGLDRGTLAGAWCELITSQFHDTIAGTCADQVATEQAARLTGVRAVAAEEFGRGIDHLVGHDPDLVRERSAETEPRLVLWNPVARPRGGVVILDTTWFVRDELVGPPGDRRPAVGSGARPFGIRSSTGAAITQVLATRRDLERRDAPRHYPDLDRVDRVFVAAEVGPVPGLGAVVYSITEPNVSPQPPSDPVVAGPRSLRNNRLEVTVDQRGGLRLADRSRRNVIEGLGGFEWLRDRGDCYTPELGDSRGTFRLHRVEPIAPGPLVGALALQWALEDQAERIVGRTTVSVTAGSDLVRIRLVLDNQARHHRLRWCLPIGPATGVLAGGPHGVVRRPPGTVDRSWPGETGLPTDPAHRFVGAARGNRGLAVFAPGFFEYQWDADGNLFVTLVRSVGDLSIGDLAGRPGHAAWSTKTPMAQETHRHVVELALQPIDEAILQQPARMIETWEDVFLPPVPRWYRQSLPLAAAGGLELRGDGLVLEAVHHARSGGAIIVRALSVANELVEGAWHCPWPVAAAERVRADETPLGPLSVENRSVRFDAEPGALVSIKLTPGR